MTIASLSEFAKLISVRPSYVTKLKKDGRLVLTADGKVEVEASQLRIKETEDPNRNDVRQRHATNRAQKDETPPPSGSPLPAQPAGTAMPDPSRNTDMVSASFQKARALGEHFSAKSRALEFLKEVGEVVEISQIRDEVENIISIARTAFDNLPGQLAPQLVTMTDEQAIDRLLQEHIEAVLGEMSQKLRAVTNASAETT